MKVAQLAAYSFEGSVNKMIVDDKGVLILILFGLAPLHHVCEIDIISILFWSCTAIFCQVDDPQRACFCAQRVSTTIQSIRASPFPIFEELLDSYGTARLRRDGIYDDLSERIPVGIGVATGRWYSLWQNYCLGTVWCGTVGTDFRCEYTALGDPVNLSARLMGKAMTDKYASLKKMN